MKLQPAADELRLALVSNCQIILHSSVSALEKDLTACRYHSAHRREKKQTLSLVVVLETNHSHNGHLAKLLEGICVARREVSAAIKVAN